MKTLGLSLWAVGAVAAGGWSQTPAERAPTAEKIPETLHAKVSYDQRLDLMVFELKLSAPAIKATPEARGTLDTAPVVGYVFPTTLDPENVGFRGVEGIVALAVTAHPDFDDTPLWDEDGDANYKNDGAVFHTHWVVLTPDERVPGGLSVASVAKEAMAESLPPTHPGMPMYMDSPGHSVVLDRDWLRVLVPAQRIGGVREFNYDVVSCYMEVNTSDSARPMLGVYRVYQALSGDLSLPYETR